MNFDGLTQTSASPIATIILIIILIYLFGVTIGLLIIKLTLRVPPIRHLAQSIYKDITGND